MQSDQPKEQGHKVDQESEFQEERLQQEEIHLIIKIRFTVNLFFHIFYSQNCYLILFKGNKNESTCLSNKHIQAAYLAPGSALGTDEIPDFRELMF